MTRKITLALAIAAFALPAQAALAQKVGVERLYIMNCGDGVAGDIGRWSPGVNEGKSMEFADTCYLVKHSQGWFLWDTGISDAVAEMPNGLVPADPKATTWKRPKTLASQLEQIGVKPADINAMGVSHSHPDHTGNVEMFPQARLYVQKVEYDWPGANNEPRFKPSHPVELLAGDKDVFGDGSITILSTPGHTPGHQSLLVRLPKTGAVVLSGDAVHFKDNWDNHRVPTMNTNKDQTTASMQKIADTLDKEKGQLWINHDKAQRDSQKMSPEFYE
ncbi:N-acyl homoserine lactonase family protein [Bradyrhizobium manausense]|uniref:N-acyl homoserine lactonase family protein n=1 Tax=Bradyrhizobium manausense TaxID=989370 RepID=UPI001BAC58E8|nr:N-acyl homoserine lactonase family protein [Bradyrhizobium manausense]MBR1085880.1 N-acyl homoserine lactonase family protein [Bradyrhizobium manausense]